LYPSDQLDFGIKSLWYNGLFTPETQKQLKKSTARLAAKLVKAGYNLNRPDELDRAELLEALAEIMLAEPSAESKTDFIREARKASQVPLSTGDSSSAVFDKVSAALRLRKLKLEEKQAAKEAEKRKAAWEAEAQRLVFKAKQKKLEADERKSAWDAEAQRLAMEFEKTKAGNRGETEGTGGDGCPGASRAKPPFKSQISSN